MEDSIFYHEDFYRQIELIPTENYFKALRDITENSSSDTATEYGFLTIKEREEQKIKTEDLNIHIDSIKRDLTPFTIKYFKTVTTGYSSTVKIKKNTIAIGFERLALFFELNDTDIIKHIWMCQSTILPKAPTCKNLLNALLALGNNYDLILVDWNEEVSIRLSSIETVQKYLEESFSFNFPPK